MSAAGRVVTGFSKPYVAEYAANAGTVTYSNPELLNQREYRNMSIWNPAICITDYADKRLVKIEE